MILNCPTKSSFHIWKLLHPNNSLRWWLPGTFLGRQCRQKFFEWVSPFLLRFLYSQAALLLGLYCCWFTWLHTGRTVWSFWCVCIYSLWFPPPPCLTSMSPVFSEIKYKFTIFVGITKSYFCLRVSSPTESDSAFSSDPNFLFWQNSV